MSYSALHHAEVSRRYASGTEAEIAEAGGVGKSAKEYAESVNPDRYAQSDLSNITQAGKNEAVSWGIPDYSAGVNYGLSTIAPSDGLVVAKSTNNQSGQSISLRINNTKILEFSIGSQGWARQISLPLPVSKGDEVLLAGTGASSIIFYPLKGVN